jgi:hypothetical protein
MINETLAILKLCSNFGNKKDIRGFTQAVQVVRDPVKDEIKFYASNGYVLIKVTRKDALATHHEILPDNVTLESISKACKVERVDLLQTMDYEIRFPEFDKTFNQKEETCLNDTKFDCAVMATIFKSLETFRRDIKMKLAVATIGPLSRDSANFITVMVNEGLQAEIKIQIAVMPLKP